MSAWWRCRVRPESDRVCGSVLRQSLSLNGSALIGHNASIPLSTRRFLIQILVSFWLQFGVAQAAEELPATLSGNAQAHAVPVLCLQIAAAPRTLDVAAVRSAIEQELGISTSSVVTPVSVGTVRVEAGNGVFVTVRYESADRGTLLKRRLALPVEPARRVTVIAWVVGNLVRNEADEILLGMMNRRERPARENAAVGTPTDATNEATASGSSKSEGAQANAGDAVPPKQQPKAEAHQTPVPLARKPLRSPETRPLSPDLGATRYFHAALLSPTLAWPADAAQRAFHLSLGGIYSQVGALKGVGFGWFVNRIEYCSSGMQISGLWLDGNEHAGVLLAGLATHSRGDLSGAEVAGLLTVRTGSVVGAQLALIGTYAGHYLGGMQIAGVTAISNGRSGGLQLSGVLSYSASDVKGVQIAGAVNMANYVNGVQLGLLNVARDVDGLQLGVVNVARHNRGIALGLFNWSEGARLQPTYFYQTPGYHNAGYRTLSGYSTGTISFGYDPSTKRARTHFATGPRYAYGRFAVGAELGYGWVLENMSGKPSDRAHELDVVGNVSFEVVRNGLSVYAGGGVVLPVAGVVAIEPRGLAQVGISMF